MKPTDHVAGQHCTIEHNEPATLAQTNVTHKIGWILYYSTVRVKKQSP